MEKDCRKKKNNNKDSEKSMNSYDGSPSMKKDDSTTRAGPQARATTAMWERQKKKAGIGDDKGEKKSVNQQRDHFFFALSSRSGFVHVPDAVALQILAIDEVLDAQFDLPCVGGEALLEVLHALRHELRVG